jgi:hypothetical protein
MLIPFQNSHFAQIGFNDIAHHNEGL